MAAGFKRVSRATPPSTVARRSRLLRRRAGPAYQYRVSIPGLDEAQLR
jgi:hypothetical protein